MVDNLGVGGFDQVVNCLFWASVQLPPQGRSPGLLYDSLVSGEKRQRKRRRIKEEKEKKKEEKEKRRRGGEEKEKKKRRGEEEE